MTISTQFRIAGKFLEISLLSSLTLSRMDIKTLGMADSFIGWLPFVGLIIPMNLNTFTIKTMTKAIAMQITLNGSLRKNILEKSTKVLEFTLGQTRLVENSASGAQGEKTAKPRGLKKPSDLPLTVPKLPAVSKMSFILLLLLVLALPGFTFQLFD